MSNIVKEIDGKSNIVRKVKRYRISPGKGKVEIKADIDNLENKNAGFFVPTIDNTKVEITEYLDKMNIEYSLTMRKQELLDLIK